MSKQSKQCTVKVLTFYVVFIFLLNYCHIRKLTAGESNRAPYFSRRNVLINQSFTFGLINRGFLAGLLQKLCVDLISFSVFLGQMFNRLAGKPNRIVFLCHHVHFLNLSLRKRALMIF